MISGWTWRAPNEITGCGAAASTHSRAAVAQPVDCESIPRIAVSYRANRLYRARIRSTISLGADPVAVLERVHAGHGWIAGGEDVADEVLRLVHAAQDRVFATEDLHRDDGVDALPFEDALRAGEVHVTRRAGQDLRRWTGVG